jgi:hypothetical protein
MNDDSVLHIALRFNHHGMNLARGVRFVGPYHYIRPHVHPMPNPDIADDLSGGIHEGGVIDFRPITRGIGANPTMRYRHTHLVHLG